MRIPRWSLVVFPVLLAACSEKPAPVAAARPVLVMTVGAQARSPLSVYAGEVRARREAEVGFRAGGKLLERRANLGDRVRKGEVLARMDGGDLALSAAASAAQVSAAEADVALARAEHDRAKSLADKQFVSGTLVDTRRAQLQAAEARFRQASAQAGVAGNQASYAVLVADRDGVVTGVLAEIGQVVASGQPVFRIADPAEREVLINVPESRVAALKVGQSAAIRPWNQPDKSLVGTIREIAGSADTATRTFAVRVAAPAAVVDLPLGTTAAVAFGLEGGVSGAAAPVVVLPLPAVLRQAGKASVWVVGADSTAQLREVEVTSYADDGAVVRGGLKSGERVVTVGAHALVQGMPLRPVSDQAPPALDAAR